MSRTVLYSFFSLSLSLFSFGFKSSCIRVDLADNDSFQGNSVLFSFVELNRDDKSLYFYCFKIKPILMYIQLQAYFGSLFFFCYISNNYLCLNTCVSRIKKLLRNERVL